MTFLEASFLYGVKEITTSIGDNLLRLTQKIYDSRDEKYTRSLLALNTRYDWDNIMPGSKVKYLSKEVVNQVSEIW